MLGGSARSTLGVSLRIVHVFRWRASPDQFGLADADGLDEWDAAHHVAGAAAVVVDRTLARLSALRGASAARRLLNAADCPVVLTGRS